MHLAKFSQLKEVNIEGCKRLSDTAIELLKKALPKCKVIDQKLVADLLAADLSDGRFNLRAG